MMLLLLLVKYALLSLHMLLLFELQMLQISCTDIFFCQKGGKSRHGQRQRRNGFFVHAGQGRSGKKIIARPTTDNNAIVTRCISLGAPSLTQYLTSSSSSHHKDEGAAQLSKKYETFLFKSNIMKRIGDSFCDLTKERMFRRKYTVSIT